LRGLVSWCLKIWEFRKFAVLEKHAVRIRKIRT